MPTFAAPVRLVTIVMSAMTAPPAPSYRSRAPASAATGGQAAARRASPSACDNHETVGNHTGSTHGRTRLGRHWLVAVALLAAACQKSTPTAPTSPAYTVTVSAAGVSPSSLDVPLGSRVLFVNNDGRAHYLHSDPHPDATDCPALNQVGLLSPSQKRETGNLVDAKVCGFHDHDDPTNTAFRGRIVVK
jgi:hypothetical protein